MSPVLISGMIILVIMVIMNIMHPREFLKNKLLFLWILCYGLIFWWGVYYAYSFPKETRTQWASDAYVIFNAIWILVFLFLWKKRK